MNKELLRALQTAIKAMNATPSFDTGLPDPDRPGRTMSSYQLLPKLEAIARRAWAGHL